MFRKIFDYKSIKSNPALFANIAVLVLSFLAFADAATAAGLSIGGGSGGFGIRGSIGGFGFSFGSGSGGGGIGDALCQVVHWITDEGIGQAVASLAVIFLGVQAFFGKVNWGTAVMFTAGIFAIFGAQDIVGAITGGYGGGDC